MPKLRSSSMGSALSILMSILNFICLNNHTLHEALRNPSSCAVQIANVRGVSILDVNILVASSTSKNLTLVHTNIGPQILSFGVRDFLTCCNLADDAPGDHN
jgi:hypothetical protein